MACRVRRQALSVSPLPPVPPAGRAGRQAALRDSHPEGSPAPPAKARPSLMRTYCHRPPQDYWRPCYSVLVWFDSTYPGTMLHAMLLVLDPFCGHCSYRGLAALRRAESSQIRQPGPAAAAAPPTR